MIYRERTKLTIIELQENEENILLARLGKIILNRPSDIIYCERNGKLHGIITMGDISRVYAMGNGFVNINEHFMSVSNGEYMKARKIFFEKGNINALPVLNEDGNLIGDWMRWNDLFVWKHAAEIAGVMDCENCHVAFVRPNDAFQEKQEIYDLICENLYRLGVKVRRIGASEISEYAETVNHIMFVDEDEYRAYDAVYKYIIFQGEISEKFVPYNCYLKSMRVRLAESFLPEISKNGVHIFNMRFERNRFYQEIVRQICFKYSNSGNKISSLLLPSMYQDFFCGLYSGEDADWIAHLSEKIAVKGGSGEVADYKSKYFNVANGERYTAGQPSEYQKTVYFVGPCFVYGALVEDKNTIQSFLQERFNRLNYNIRVVNYGSPSHFNNIARQLDCIMRMPLSKGDMVLLYADDKTLDNIPEINLTDAIEKHDIDPGWMVESPRHCNHKVNALYAEVIFDALEPFLVEDAADKSKMVKFEGSVVKSLYIDHYFSGVDLSVYNRIGSIVMNCNPFTYGHRYLIEQALQMVDYLIIFVVEEDRSVFTFDERFAMVREGTSDMEKVMAVPSGPFILSQTTFPEYFIKARDEDLVENVENDIMLFAKEIAPRLNIKYRFVGEEPEDTVTNEYNMAMKRILPGNGIQLIELPRKMENGNYISASSVRKCLERNKFSDLHALVPESTLRIIYGKLSWCQCSKRGWYDEKECI